MKSNFISEYLLACIFGVTICIIFSFLFDKIVATFDFPLFLSYALTCLLVSATHGALMRYISYRILQLPLRLETAMQRNTLVFSFSFLAFIIFVIVDFYNAYGFRNLVINYLVPFCACAGFLTFIKLPYNPGEHTQIQTSSDAKSAKKISFYWACMFAHKNIAYNNVCTNLTVELDQYFYQGAHIHDVDRKLREFQAVIENMAYIHSNLATLGAEYRKHENTYQHMKKYEQALKEAEALRSAYVSAKAEELKYEVDEDSKKYAAIVKKYEQEAEQKFPVRMKN